ncbi:branched-chain amino acid ABC transporter permease [Pseudonocardia acaciae]|uniref:branched-chain amino acid ABC transporter permease n=1 Tax=Pseudonocardia acaciae TaxID=551276 RepID=UPI00048EEE09|nr:branched-chain amino acid ABC transporter permease [Pseudonocardia acaciae]
MPIWLQAHLVSVLNGFAIGFLLFILAVGLSLVFGMMDVLNLAHGALFLGGAYLGATLGGTASWGGFLAALGIAAVAGLAAGGALSLMTEPLRNRSHLDQALLTLGVALVAAELLSIVFGDNPLAASAPSGLDGSVAVLGATYPTYRLALIGIGAVLALAVYLVVDRTWVGALVRATVADREMVTTVGVDNRLVKAAVFAVGSLLATTAGVLGGPIYGARSGLDSTVLILALVVVVIGGLGSVRGALVGALVIGQIESLGRALLPDLASFVLFGALAVVLVLRPRGLFGQVAVDR